jgi:hypothetical protein
VRKGRWRDDRQPHGDELRYRRRLAALTLFQKDLIRFALASVCGQSHAQPVDENVKSSGACPIHNW